MFRQYQGEEPRTALSNCLIPAHSGQYDLSERISTLEETGALDRFLAGVERRAIRMAQIAAWEDDQTLEPAQEVVLKLVERYGARRSGMGAAVSSDSAIRDSRWHRRTKVRSRRRLWLGRDQDGEEAGDPLDAIADPTTPTGLLHRRISSHTATGLPSEPLSDS